MDNDRLLIVGKIVGMHGIRGGVRVYSYDGTGDLFYPGAQFIPARQISGFSRLTVQAVQPHKNILRIMFSEIGDRDMAEALAGAELAVRRGDLPEPAPGTWYWCDLMGLAVYEMGGTYLGQVEHLLETGSNDVLVVRQDNEEILIPVTASVVRDVDFESKKISVDLPEGLL